MFRPARIAEKNLWAPGLASFVLDLQAPVFRPGQFFNLTLPSADGAELAQRKRSYSAANAPGQPFEFLISEVSQGSLTPSLFRREPGDEVLVDETPLGFFTLDEVPESQYLWLVSTGTGLSPYLSMLRTGQDLQRFERIIVVHGATSVVHLAHREELVRFADRDQVTYVPVTSRQDPPQGGLRGRVTQCLDDGSLEGRVGTRIDERSHVLLCGNPRMVEDFSAALKARGLSKHRRRSPGHFSFEKYW